MKNVKLIRLRRTPEEFIAEVHDDTDDGITIEQPMVLVHQGNQMGFYPWTPFSANRTFVLRNDDLLFEPRELPEALVRAYIEQTSGIALPTPQTNNGGLIIKD